MEGIVRKAAHKLQLFQRGAYQKRYLIVDFTSANIMLKHDKTVVADPTFLSTDDCKFLPFRSILDCYQSRKDDSTIKRSFPSSWQFCFWVLTSEREYMFLCQSENERKMWMAGFRYVIASTKTVQNIMKNNLEQQKQKLRDRTEQFL